MHSSPASFTLPWFFTLVAERNRAPSCPAQLYPLNARLTRLSNPFLTDKIGNEVYASHYAERKLSRFVIGTETVLLLGAFGLIFSLAHRPIANRYIRIDEMGRAQAIAYTDLNYSPPRGRSDGRI